jgi:hypothetical protein
MSTCTDPKPDADVGSLPTAPLPLTGVRVLDLGHVFQGPYATFLMAMAGADVIKIEPPRGDMSRRRRRDGDYPFRALNGCKRGIVLNLKTERGRELLLKLSRSADVLVENFAPAVMPRLGLGPEVFQKVNPRLIYASASGFGRTGPCADKVSRAHPPRAQSNPSMRLICPMPPQTKRWRSRWEDVHLPLDSGTSNDGPSVAPVSSAIRRAESAKALIWSVFTQRAFDSECISDLYRRDEGPEGATPRREPSGSPVLRVEP